MMKLFVVVMVVLGCVFSVQANLLLNPSFETAGAGGSWDPANWSRSDGNDRTDIASWGGDWHAQDGSWAMKLGNYGGTPGSHWLGQEVAWDVGIDDVVTFSFYAFSNNDPFFRSAYVDIGMMTDGDDTWFNNLSFSAGLSNQTYGSGWVQYSFKVTNATPNVNAIQAWINITDVDSPGGTDLLLDSASLTYIPEPMSVALMGLAGMVIYAVRRRRS